MVTMHIKSKKTVKIMFEDFWRPAKQKYIRRNSLFKLLSKHYNLVLSDKPDFLLYSSFGYEYLKYDCIRIFYTGENVRPNFEECDYAFSFDYPNTERNYRLPLYRLSSWYDIAIKTSESRSLSKKHKKFCCFLYSNSEAQERISFFQLLSQYKRIDSGGKVLNNLGHQIPRNETIEWMKNYKFCIAFENASYPGYTTEKLLHALVANTIPIYWGIPLASKDFNQETFIDCNDYDSFDDAIEIVKKIDQDEALHKFMLSQSYFPHGNESWSCKEKNIITRFDKIFSDGKNYIPKELRQKQRKKYPYFLTKRYINKILESVFRK